jgi:hypothetical protein
MFRERYRTATVRETVPLPIFSRLLSGRSFFFAAGASAHDHWGNPVTGTVSVVCSSSRYSSSA